MTHSFASLALAALLSLAPPAFAQGMHHAQAMNAPGEMPWVDGEVRRVDKDNGKVTLKHGEIKNLDMPPMTMVFHVRDKTQLDGLAVGDKVRFTATHDKGQMWVQDISVLKP